VDITKLMPKENLTASSPVRAAVENCAACAKDTTEKMVLSEPTSNNPLSSTAESERAEMWQLNEADTVSVTIETHNGAVAENHLRNTDISSSLSNMASDANHQIAQETDAENGGRAE
jgi:hypothetical protein